MVDLILTWFNEFMRDMFLKQITINIFENIPLLFNGFVFTKLCVCSQKLKIQNMSDGIFVLPPGSCPREGLGCLGVKN